MTGSTTVVEPLTDLEHWGVVERWNYPDDGKGDCEDYVLLKRRMLMQAGWPREALLITVVRDKKGDGHAVLTVKTNRGEFVLDNQVGEILRLEQDRLPLREAAVAVRPQQLGCARRAAHGARPPSRRVDAGRMRLMRGKNRNRGPGHVPTPPRPQTGFASGRPSPRGRPHLFENGKPCVWKSADPLQAGGILLEAPHIDVGAAADQVGRFLVERADDARGRADDQ